MRKITRIDDYIIERVKLNYHYEYLVYHKMYKEEGIYFKTFKEALQVVMDKINY